MEEANNVQDVSNLHRRRLETAGAVESFFAALGALKDENLGIALVATDLKQADPLVSEFVHCINKS